MYVINSKIQKIELSAQRQWVTDNFASGLTKSDENQLQSWNVASAGSGAIAWHKTGSIISGKIYCEISPRARPADMVHTIGIATAGANQPWAGGIFGALQSSGGCGLPASGRNINGAITVGATYGFTLNDIIMLAVDTAAQKLWIGKNGSWLSGDPGTGGTEDIAIGADPYYFYSGMYSCFISSGTFQNRIYNTSDNRNYPPPSGFTLYNEQ